MKMNLVQEAVDSALKCEWQESIRLNLIILKENKDDIDSLNRLARAYFEIGEIKKAISTSQRALKSESGNEIALNALKKYKNCSKVDFRQDSKTNIDPTIFIEEVGKTKLVNLINLGPNKTISALSSGDELKLAVHAHRVTVNTVDGKYVGKIKDDLSARLRNLVTGGNIYKVFVKSANSDCFKVLIRESKRGKGLESTISFPRDASESISEEFSNFNS